MKKVLGIILLFSFFYVSCSDREDTSLNEEILESEAFSNLNLNLNLDKEIVVESSEFGSLLEEYSDDFFENSFDLVLSSGNVIIKYVSFGDNYETTGVNNSPLFGSMYGDVNCVTCRGKKCVEETIGKAVQDGYENDKKVYIRTRNKKTLGVTVGVEVCWSDEVFASMVSDDNNNNNSMNMEDESSDAGGISGDEVLGEDEVL